MARRLAPRRLVCLALFVLLFVLLQLVFAAYVMQLTHRASAEGDMQHLEAEEPLIAEPAAVAAHAGSDDIAAEGEHTPALPDEPADEGEPDRSAAAIARKE
eukprot:2237476-Prymnesium_polylepis.1